MRETADKAALPANGVVGLAPVVALNDRVGRNVAANLGSQLGVVGG